MSALDSSNVNISGNTTFSGNSVSQYGGGVSAWESSNVYINGNTTFSGNSANVDGGGVSAQDSSNVDISGNTTFIGNSVIVNMVEELVHGRVAMCTSMGTPLSVVTRLMLMVEE